MASETDRLVKLTDKAAVRLNGASVLFGRTQGLLGEVLRSQGADADMRLVELREEIEQWQSEYAQGQEVKG